MGPYEIVLADDHAMIRQGLKKILTERNGLEVIGEVGDGLELLKLLNSVDPDLIILDISMPNLRGMEAIQEVKAIRPEVAVLILTMHKDKRYLFEAISAGAEGYILKEDSDTELFSAIEAIRQGRIFISSVLSEESKADWVQICRGNRRIPFAPVLTNREKEVLKLIAEGKSNKEIADLLDISVRTEEKHRANIMEKLNMKNSADLIRYAIENGYL
jgi:DNA-binding NarL/FixJ family response regulator